MGMTAGEVAAQRATATDHLPDLATITDPGTVTTTGSGGTTVVSPVVTGGVPCRLAKPGTQSFLLEFGEQLVADSDYIATFPTGTSIQAGWFVDVNGTRYTVLAVGKTVAWSTAVRAAIKLLEVVPGG